MPAVPDRAERPGIRRARQAERPNVVAHGIGFGLNQGCLDLSGFPPVFLEEFPDQLPPDLVVLGDSEMASEPGQARRLVLDAHGDPISARTPNPEGLSFRRARFTMMTIGRRHSTFLCWPDYRTDVLHRRLPGTQRALIFDVGRVGARSVNRGVRVCGYCICDSGGVVNAVSEYGPLPPYRCAADVTAMRSDSVEAGQDA